MAKHVFLNALLLTFGAALIAPNVAQAKLTSHLAVQVTGLKKPEGQVCLRVFSQPQGFPSSGPAIASRCVTVANQTLQVNFGRLAAGNYAIAVIHDLNQDGRLNQGALGVPLEGFGFSKNPPLRFGPASFQESQFRVAGGKTSIKIQMRYLQ